MLASPPEDYFYGNDDGANTGIAQAFPSDEPLASMNSLP
jgi:hypothetical protein